MIYYVEDLINILENVKDNPYGIEDTYHALKRAQKRNINLNTVNSNICTGPLVGIEKSFNENSIFQLLYENDSKEDLSIIINILDEDKIDIISIIKRTTNKRKHYAY